jgi:hypothetical protein
MGRKQQNNLEVHATASPGDVPTILNYPSVINVPMAHDMSRIGNLGVERGDLRTDRTTDFFLSSLASSNVATLPSVSLGDNFPSMTSMHGNISSATTSDAVGIGQNCTNISNDSGNLFLQLLMNEAQRQQLGMQFLRQSNEMSMLSQNETDFQRRRIAAALGGTTGSNGLASLPDPRIMNLTSPGSLLPSAAMTGVGHLNNSNLLLQLQIQLQLQQRAEALGSRSTGPRDNLEDDTRSGDTTHREPPV